MINPVILYFPFLDFRKGPAGLFRDAGFSTLFRRDIGFIIAGNGIRYTHDTGNVLIFLLDERKKYDSVISGQIIVARSNKTHI